MFTQGNESGKKQDDFTILYNILIRLIYENKRLTREQEDSLGTLTQHENEKIKVLNTLGGKNEGLLGKQWEVTLNQLHHMNQKNAQLEKQNKEIDNKVWERRRDHTQLFQNTLDLMIEMIKGKMKSPENSEELTKIIAERDQILLLCTEIEIEDQEIKTVQVKAKIIAGELQTLKQ